MGAVQVECGDYLKEEEGMLSKHRKTREWQKSLPGMYDLQKVKGEPVGAVHPSSNQSFGPNKAQGVTDATISNCWPAVK